MLQASYLVSVSATQFPQLSLKVAHPQGHMLACVISTLHVQGKFQRSEKSMLWRKKLRLGKSSTQAGAQKQHQPAVASALGEQWCRQIAYIFLRRQLSQAVLQLL